MSDAMICAMDTGKVGIELYAYSDGAGVCDGAVAVIALAGPFIFIFVPNLFSR
jgi:hypothetical protein